MKHLHLFSLLIAVTMMAMCPLGLRAEAFQQGTAPTKGDGSSESPYEIGTADELLWFACCVTNYPSYLSICAKLTADITFTSSTYANTMIANTYSGTFDGNGHKITVSFDRSENNAALFQALKGTVKNLTVDGTIKTSAKFAAGICAHSYGGTVTGCTSLVDIESSVSGDGTHAGICAVAENEDHGTTIEDCVFAGKINGSSTTNCAGILGYNGNDRASIDIKNCLVTATFGISTTGCNTIVRNNATISNCYYKNSLGDVPSGVTQVTADQLASGEIAYKLQNGRTDLVWGQNITTDPKDSRPVLGGSRVYASNLNCAGQPTSFSNTEATPTQADHIFDTAHTHAAVAATCTTYGNVAYKECTVCGKYFDTEGNEITDYTLPCEIKTADDLLSFANQVNGGNDAINAKLIADIDFTSSTYANTMIGMTKYSGTFDGNGHTIKVSFNRTENDAALFENLYGTVKNLTVDGTITTSAQNAAGICANSYGGTVTGCTSLVDIKSSYSGYGYHGGICAEAHDGGITINDCLFAGKIDGGSTTTGCGGIAGWGYDATISNCLVLATFTFGISINYGNTIARNSSNATITNCYYLNSLVDVPSGATQVTDAQLASGEVAYKLQNGRTDLVWGQNLSTDSHPVLGGSTRVYAHLNCAGQPTSFSNTETTPTQDAHTFDADHTHAAVAATCATAGNVAYQECTVCHKYINTEGKEITNYVIAAFGHNFENGVCTRCNAYAKAYTYVQQNNVAVTAVGTAAFDLSDSPTVEFVDGKAVMKVGSNEVAKLPISDDGQLAVEFGGTVSNVSKTLTNDYATLYSPFQLQVPSTSDVEVYAPTYEAPMLKLNDGTKVAAGAIIPAGTGLILKNNGTIDFTFSADAATDSHVSALSGSALTIAKPEESGKTVYTLGHESTDDTKFGFYAYSGENMNPGYAYLLATTVVAGGDAKYVSFSLDDDETSINGVATTGNTNHTMKYIENGRIFIVKNGQKYNLNGQEVK